MFPSFRLLLLRVKFHIQEGAHTLTHKFTHKPRASSSSLIKTKMRIYFFHHQHRVSYNTITSQVTSKCLTSSNKRQQKHWCNKSCEKAVKGIVHGFLKWVSLEGLQTIILPVADSILCNLGLEKLTFKFEKMDELTASPTGLSSKWFGAIFKWLKSQNFHSFSYIHLLVKTKTSCCYFLRFKINSGHVQTYKIVFAWTLKTYFLFELF